MQHLAEKWLKLANKIYIALAVIYLAAYSYFAVKESTVIIQDKDWYGITFESAIFCLVFIAYSIFLLKLIAKNSVWIAYVIGFVLFAIALNIAVEACVNTPWVGLYLTISGLFVIFATIYGPVAGLLGLLISGVIYAMSATGTINGTYYGLVGDSISIAIRTLGVLLLIFLFNDKYVSDEKDNKKSYIERYFVKNEVVRLLTNSIGDGVIIIDEKEIVRSINPTALQLFGQKESDALDLNYRSLLKLKNVNNTNIEPAKEPVTLALKTQAPVRQEYLLNVPGKQESYVDVTVSVIKDDEKQSIYGAVIIIRDVSKKKQEENARSEFISTASHEMRTPVAAIEGYLALALNPTVSKVDDKARGFLQKAHESTQHLGRLFQDLLVSAKAEDGRLINHPVVIDVGGLLEQQAEYFKMMAAKKNLQLEFVTSSGGQSPKKENLPVIKPLYYVHADPDRIKEIATNLIDNALKYTQEGKITVGITGNDELVQFFIKDTGVGISQDDIPHLFQKFYRVDSSDTRTTGGTGLGLFICKKITDLYKGRIWAESQLGQGTTFYVNLPRLSSAMAESLKAKEHLQVDSTSPSSQSVKT